MVETAICVRNVSKKYRLFNSQADRLKEAFSPFRRKHHHDFWALQDVSVDIPRGRTVGIVGRNGSGKSTLLQIICGILRPTSGDVTVNGRIAALLELGAGFNPEFSGRDNVLLNGAIQGVSREEMIARLPVIEAFADVGEFFDQPVKTYSSGMFVRVAFAAAINIEPDILIVDEALAVGDVRFQEKCYRKFQEFRQQGRTILFVTHDTRKVLEFCSHAVLLEQGRVVCQGDPQETLDVYEELLFPRAREVTAVADAAPKSVVVPASDENAAAPATAAASDLLRRFLAERHADDRCPQRRSYNAQEIRFGEGGARIVDYLIAVGDDFDPVTIRSRSRVDVYLKTHGGDGVRRPDIGIGIFTATGQMICSGSTILSSMRIDPIAAGETRIYRISFDCMMTAGHYFLHFALTEPSPDGEIRHDARRSVATFEVPVESFQEGLCDLRMAVADLTPVDAT
jgi:lipopolysaccharide transport system ATP-binding protein